MHSSQGCPGHSFNGVMMWVEAPQKKDTNQGQEELTQLLFSLLVSSDFPHDPCCWCHTRGGWTVYYLCNYHLDGAGVVPNPNPLCTHLTEQNRGWNCLTRMRFPKVFCFSLTASTEFLNKIPPCLCGGQSHPVLLLEIWLSAMSRPDSNTAQSSSQKTKGRDILRLWHRIKL